MLEGYCYVYKVTHLPSGKAYVGLTNDFERRKYEHLKAARLGSQSHFHRALRKHGADQFDWRVMSRCSSLELASHEEQLLVKHFATYGDGGFNMTTGGESRWSKVTKEETKEKLAALYRGKTYEELHGSEMAAEIRQKQSAAHAGRVFSERTRTAMSEANKRRWREGGIGKKGRPVEVSGVRYANFISACRALGLSKYEMGKWVKSNFNGARFCV